MNVLCFKEENKRFSLRSDRDPTRNNVRRSNDAPWPLPHQSRRTRAG